jgi:hypothetical protein
MDGPADRDAQADPENQGDQGACDHADEGYPFRPVSRRKGRLGELVRHIHVQGYKAEKEFLRGPKCLPGLPIGKGIGLLVIPLLHLLHDLLMGLFPCFPLGHEVLPHHLFLFGLGKRLIDLPPLLGSLPCLLQPGQVPLHMLRVLFVDQDTFIPGYGGLGLVHDLKAFDAREPHDGNLTQRLVST